MDEVRVTVAKEGLHNFKLDGENKIKVCLCFLYTALQRDADVGTSDYIREKIVVFFILQLIITTKLAKVRQL